MTNTKSINLGATDNVRTPAWREDENMEKAKQAVERCIQSCEERGIRQKENVQIMKMEREIENLKRDICNIPRCHTI